MNRRTGSLAAAILTIASVPAAAQWLNVSAKGIPRTKDGKPDLSAPQPRMPDGKPDLSGLWAFVTSAGGLSQLKPGEIPPWVEELLKQRREDLLKDSPTTQCLPLWNMGGLTKIIQTPALIVMLREALIYRQIFLDGRDLPKDPNPAWMGYSVGRWEGDTLVVESTGYNERAWLENLYPHTEDLRITERFHRRDFGHLDLDVTLRDPAIYEKPWTVKVDGLLTADTELIESVCAENEKDRIHLVGKMSDDTKNAVQLAPEILAEYAGTYAFRASELGAPGPEIVEVKIAVENGVLMRGPLFGGSRKVAMTPLSENTFMVSDGPVEFGKNDKGEVTHMMMRLNRGEFRGERKRESK